MHGTSLWELYGTCAPQVLQSSKPTNFRAQHLLLCCYRFCQSRSRAGQEDNLRPHPRHNLRPHPRHLLRTPSGSVKQLACPLCDWYAPFCYQFTTYTLKGALGILRGATLGLANGELTPSSPRGDRAKGDCGAAPPSGL